LPTRSLQKLGIIWADGGREDHHLRIVHILRGVAKGNTSAQPLKTFRDRAAFNIRTGDGEAQVQQHFGNATHPDAADAHEMDSLNLS